MICSDIIFRQLSNFIPELKHAVLHDEKGLLGDLDFHINEFLSPRDFYRIAQVHSPEYFTLHHVYTEEEITSQQDNKVPFETEDSQQNSGGFHAGKLFA